MTSTGRVWSCWTQCCDRSLVLQPGLNQQFVQFVAKCLFKMLDSIAGRWREREERERDCLIWLPGGTLTFHKQLQHVAANLAFPDCRNFNTSYFAKGSLITSQREIAKHYLFTWFLLDASLVVLDYFTVAHTWMEEPELVTIMVKTSTSRKIM